MCVWEPEGLLQLLVGEVGKQLLFGEGELDLRRAHLGYKILIEKEETSQELRTLASTYKCPEKSSLNVNHVFPVCIVCPICTFCPVCPVCSVSLFLVTNVSPKDLLEKS